MNSIAQYCAVGNGFSNVILLNLLTIARPLHQRFPDMWSLLFSLGLVMDLGYFVQLGFDYSTCQILEGAIYLWE